MDGTIELRNANHLSQKLQNKKSSGPWVELFCQRSFLKNNPHWDKTLLGPHNHVREKRLKHAQNACGVLRSNGEQTRRCENWQSSHWTRTLVTWEWRPSFITWHGARRLLSIWYRLAQDQHLQSFRLVKSWLYFVRVLWLLFLFDLDPEEDDTRWFLLFDPQVDIRTYKCSEFSCYMNMRNELRFHQEA